MRDRNGDWIKNYGIREMVAIPENPNKTINAIDDWHSENNRSEHRTHLGASLLGDSCKRKLWYTFRWCYAPNFNGRLLRLFRRGHLEENLFTKDLRAIGVTVYSVDPSTGDQFRFAFAGGHAGGSMDGCVLGLLEAPKTWHVVEMKTHNDKSFNDLQKKGVEQSKPLHYAQMQLYMGLSGMTRAFYIAVNKNDDRLYSERIKFDKAEFERLKAKAEDIVFAEEPLERISERPDWFECRFCDFNALCHGERVAEVNCRTCAHSTPCKSNGEWRCEPQDLTLDADRQRAGCEYHVFIPALIPYAEMIEADSERAPPEWVKYRHANGVEFWNIVQPAQKALHQNAYTSRELHHAPADVIGDETANEVRTVLNAEIAG